MFLTAYSLRLFSLNIYSTETNWTTCKFSSSNMARVTSLSNFKFVCFMNGRLLFNEEYQLSFFGCVYCVFHALFSFNLFGGHVNISLKSYINLTLGTELWWRPAVMYFELFWRRRLNFLSFMFRSTVLYSCAMEFVLDWICNQTDFYTATF